MGRWVDDKLKNCISTPEHSGWSTKVYLVAAEEFPTLFLWLMSWPTLCANQMASEHIHVPPRVSITNGMQLMPADLQEGRLDDSFL